MDYRIAVVDYTYLNHVEAEFLTAEDEVGSRADEILGNFFWRRKAAQARAFTEDTLRYFVLGNGNGVEIIEEEGDWVSGNVDPVAENDYELIYEEDGTVEKDELTEEEAESYLH